MHWLAVSSDGQMTKDQMLTELAQGKFCPVVYYKENGESIVPLFETGDMALRFARRNVQPKGASVGCVALDADFETQLSAEGFKFRILNWPNKCETMVHVVYFDEDVYTHSCSS
jgi:hypothetical protein